MTSKTDFYSKECEKIDAKDVNAYFDLHLDETDPSKLILDNSWEPTEVDLTPAIKAGETKTYLKLSPSEAPTYLEYDGEDGIPQCIYGDELARIIPMTKLKDVNQEIPIADGDTYVYNATTQMFEPYPLEDTLTDLESRIHNLELTIGTLQTLVDSITNTVTNILPLLTRPAGVPADTRIAWGNINLYSDYTNNDLKTSGLYTHSIEEDVVNDEYFA